MRTAFAVRTYLALAVAAALIGCAAAGAPRAPRPAPDFKVELVGGGSVSMGELRGRPLVVGIGATWCPHCSHEAPIFKRVYEKYRGRVGVLGILMKSPRKDAEEMVKKHGLNFPVGLDPDGDIKGRFTSESGIPAVFFIDAGGYIVEEDVGGVEEDDLVRGIEKLLKK